MAAAMLSATQPVKFMNCRRLIGPTPRLGTIIYQSWVERGVLCGTAKSNSPRNVRFVPKADIPRCGKNALFDHLVGQHRERVMDRKAKCFCGCHIDGKFKADRGLNRQVRSFFTAQNAIDVRGGAPKDIGRVWAVRHKATFATNCL